MRSGRSLSLDMKIWEALKEYQIKKDFKTLSDAAEDIFKAILKVRINDK